MTTTIFFTGTIIDGAGQAAFFTRLDWVRTQCREKAGFEPAPGTLNLRVANPRAVRRLLAAGPAPLTLTPPTPEFCTAEIMSVTVAGQAAAIIIPAAAARIHGEEVVELLAPVNLRRRLEKKAGDRLAVEIRTGRAAADRPPLAAIMFDLDGTIIDSVWIYYRIVDEVLATLGLPPVTPAAIRQANRNGTFLWEKLFPAAIFAARPELKEQAWNEARRLAPRLFDNRVAIFPEAAASLRQLAKAGSRLAIVTSTPRRNMAVKLKPLAAAGLLELFREIVTADDTGRHKPHPEPLVECCRRLAVAAENSLYVGDTRIDIEAGRAAGCATVGVLTGFDDGDLLAAAAPDAVIASLADLECALSRQPAPGENPASGPAAQPG